MKSRFPEYKALDLVKITNDVLTFWDEHGTFQKSIDERKDHPDFIFYEGPPSANGKPGIHHVMARTIKDIFCRYKTMKGHFVERKAGWDTHGLPVELAVEKQLKITKDDIGSKISVEEYNDTCRRTVMQYTTEWEDLTRRMGYWVDMNKAYITYDNKYIETLWYLLKEIYKKGLLYKGYTIQPYSPAAGTGLSSHELNQPECYKMVKDTTAVALFKVINNEKSAFLFEGFDRDVFIMAWTTTPWTLLSNTALSVGGNIAYSKIRTFNPYTGQPINVVLATNLVEKYFPTDNKDLSFDDYKQGDKKIPFKILDEFKGVVLEGVRYEQLMPYQQPTEGDAFRVVLGDFVTTEDGTGVVHTAPSFGADDYRVCKQNGIGSLTLVDRKGKFVDGVGEFSGRYVKNEYDPSLKPGDNTVDIDIVTKLKREGKAFKIEKHEHTYPHCWRTHKPILYYPLDSWFIKTTAVKERLIELNKTINWQPPHTGSGRFGNWLENLVDWNLSRSRFWGTPLPIWRTKDSSEEICIGSLEELKAEAEKAVKAGVMETNPLADFIVGDFSEANYKILDLHRPYVDRIVLVSSTGEPMYRETDLIDVWFDSGAMPYAQVHYPFEDKDNFKHVFPADFIAEGVDQTRGWFFTLHAISTMVFDSISFKNIISNGLVLDKDGGKMSKTKGNVIDPFVVMSESGSDSMRWYMMVNSPPWDNLKFDINGIDEVKRKFFGTLYNTYSFFALYANVDGFTYTTPLALSDRPEIDRWIISLRNTLIKEVEESYSEYNPTRAGRAIQDFVIEALSNWYVRLNRKRFWGGEMTTDKIAAYQTLYECLLTVAKLAAPIAPFISDRIYIDLNTVTKLEPHDSVHLSFFPKYDEAAINSGLEKQMAIAQRISSMILGLRRKVNLKVRQPLSKILIPILHSDEKEQILTVKNLILSEVNVKALEFIESTAGVLVKRIKANFKTLGPRLGKQMKAAGAAISAMSQTEIYDLEKHGLLMIKVDGQDFEIRLDDVEIQSEDIPGWLVANDGNLTVALDITITQELHSEGIAREFINRIQNHRKESGFEVTDKINVTIMSHPLIDQAIQTHSGYISSQTLASSIQLVSNLNSDDNGVKFVDIDDEISTYIKIEKI